MNNIFSEEENENLESDATDMNEIGSDESDILENEDPLRFLSNLYKSPSPLFFRYDDEQILAYGELEDMQNDPTGVETGRQANITRDDRDGEWYARIDRDQREVDIPLLDIDPFGSDDDRNSDSTEEAPYRSRYDDGTDNYADAPSLSPIHNSESNDNPVNEPSVTDDNANISFADRSFNDDSDNGQNDHAPFNFEGPEADDMDNMDDLDVPSDDEGMNRQSVVNEIDDGNFGDFEMEDVCYGDEHAAESNALGRHNDGRHVKNVTFKLICNYHKIFCYSSVKEHIQASRKLSIITYKIVQELKADIKEKLVLLDNCGLLTPLFVPKKCE